MPPVAERAQATGDWKSVELRKQGRTVRRRLHGLTAQWYHVCRGKPVRVVVARAPGHIEDDLHVVCSDPAVPDAQIVQRYYDRWGIEECIQEGKQHLGMERTRGWCAKTVSRQAPLALILSTLVKLWYLQQAVKHPVRTPPPLPWYPQKASPSFRDMLASLRRAIWEERAMFKLHSRWKTNKFAKALAYALCEAA